jgi:hypothetical protein
MIIEFVDESGAVIGTLQSGADGLVATGAARGVLATARAAQRTDQQIVAQYRDWSNGYVTSRLVEDSGNGAS